MDKNDFAILRALQEDGRAVLQSGKDGWYSILSQELYSELVELWKNLMAGGLNE